MAESRDRIGTNRPVRFTVPALCWLSLLGFSTASSASADTQSSEPDALPAQLSNERTFTRWANAVELAPIRSAPYSASKRRATLRFNTEDGYPEVYVALRSRVEQATGRTWIEIRVPSRRVRRGWVRRDALSSFKRVNTLLRIYKKGLKATLFEAGRPIWRSRVGIGKAGTPTPAGRFYIRERLSQRGGGVYGPVAFGTSAYSKTLTDWPGGGVVGIHGTNQPNLIPGRPSHGCVRIPNGKITKLDRRMPIGTPVRIL